MVNVVSYAKYMQNLQKRGNIVSNWPQEFCMKFMYEQSKAKENENKKDDSLVSESPSATAARKRRKK